MTIEKRIDRVPGGQNGSDQVGAGAGKMAALLADIEPFFYRRSLTYVDVGAYRGDIFREIARSGLRIDEAHLIEPNPRAFGALEKTVRALQADGRTTCHRLALGDRAGRLRLREAGTMTKVLGPAENVPLAGDGFFDAEATTLDLLARGFRQPRISILKIDVEGYEAEVLAGAEGLLAAEAIDLIYVEAGMDPQGTQQTYYRTLEDRLRQHRYRLFRIYEQMHEWQEDSPFLRRTNLAFLSERFARNNPQRLSSELLKRRRERAALQARAAAEEDLTRMGERVAAREAELAAEADALRTELANLHRASLAELPALADQITDLHAGRTRDREALHRLGVRLAKLHRYARGLERTHLAILQSETWLATAPVRGLLRVLRRRPRPRSFEPRLLKGRGIGELPVDPAPAVDPAKGIEQVRRLEDKLWGGFSRFALAELTELKLALGAPEAAAKAAWVLARWQTANGEYAGALTNIVFARHAHPPFGTDKQQYIQEAKLLCLMGRGPEARALLDARCRDSGFDPSGALMRASSHRGTGATTADEAAALESINTVFRHFGLTDLVKLDPARPLSLDNLTGARPASVAPTHRVSVIVPAFNCAETIGTALRCLSEQSWEDLEILVVDDQSSDGTADVVADFCRDDRRFRLIRNERNSGSYACRNLALGDATGSFVTVHDSDDWSHPEKIRVQAEDLAAGSPYNFTAWSRCLPELVFIGTEQGTRTLLSLNFSSHMLRREAIIAAGGWDQVRVTGDSEFIWRMEALDGRPPRAFRKRLLLPDCPLSFGRRSNSSLTRSQATHLVSIFHGVRREYREAASHWHARLRNGEGVDALRTLGIPRFPAPSCLRPERQPDPPLDLLVIGDFNMQGGASLSAISALRAGLKAGLACGILQYRRHDLDVTRPLDPGTRDLAWNTGVRIVAPGEEVRAETVAFTHPPLAKQVMDRFPKISHDHLVVVVNQLAERNRSGTDRAYDPLAVRANLVELFGSEGLWTPISERVRRIMAADPRYPAPNDDIWTELVDVDDWCAGNPVWHGSYRARPVLGRHGRDHPLKWPADEAALRAAYCASRPCDVRFLGGARHARERAGDWPSNWTEYPFGAQDVREFLGNLDFFLHYPDRDYIEEFGRAPMEAMAVGVPVILPPEFEPTFGAAALYAEPEEVWPLVERLWRDEVAWTARVAAGRDFVHDACSYEAFPRRLERLAAAARKVEGREIAAAGQQPPLAMASARMESAAGAAPARP
jgi:FkbM family methyltransferase